MRRAQLAALSGRPYSTSLEEIIAEVKAKSAKARHTLLAEKRSADQIIILITSDRGLAGGLNINLFREILSGLPAGRQVDFKNTQYITVGKKATKFAVKLGSDILASFLSEEKSPLDLARTLSKMAIDAFRKSQASKVSILYPHFESTIKQTPKWIQLLPIEFETRNQLPETSYQKGASLLFEPSADRILESILPHHVLTQIYQNATDAAIDLVDGLTLTYNQARQEAITKELSDIITAQKAFE